MGTSWVRLVPLSVSSVALLCVALAGCGSGNPVGPTAVSRAADAASAAPVQLAAADGLGAQTADTIRISRGSIIAPSSGPGTVELRGSHGFAFDGMTTSGVDPNDACRDDTPCIPGQSISFTGTWAGMDLPGTATLQGQTYTNVGSLSSDTALRVDLAGSFVAPPQGETATIIVPFTMAGVFVSPDGTFDVEGGGRATLTLQWVAIEGLTPTWVLAGMRFEFGGGNT